MKNNTNDFEKKLHNFSQHTFNSQINELDVHILQRLKQARETALLQVQTDKTSVAIFPAWFTPVSTAAAFASITIISISLIFQGVPQQSLIANVNASPFDDIALLSSNDDIELYEDMDFYIWLEDEELKSTDKNKSSENIKSAG